MALAAGAAAQGWGMRGSGSGGGVCAQHTGCAVVLEIRFLTESR